MIFYLVQLVVLMVTAQNPKQKLYFNQTKQFRILHLTDLHFGEGITDDYNVDGLYSILRFTKPDLTIVTGDLVSGYSYNGGFTFFQDCHQKFIKPFVDLNIPYLFTLGNHDDEANLNRQEIMTYDSANELSYTMDQPFHGTNYFVPIYNSDQSQEILRIWAFDTNDFGCGDHSGSWGCIENDVIKKFRLMSPGPPNGIAAMHIPPQEFMTMYRSLPTFGMAQEVVSCPILNTGIVDAILEKKTIQYVIVGHDHKNDYGGKYPDQASNLTLMYGRKSGYGGYKVCCDRLNGGRVIDYQQISGELVVKHFIVDHQNQTFYQNKTYFPNTPKQQCALNEGPHSLNAYLYTLIFSSAYFLINIFIIVIIYLRYYVKIIERQEFIELVTKP